MVNPIARSVTKSPAPQPRYVAATTEPVHRPVPADPAVDTVKLSADAEIHLLRSQGQTVDQIAVGLNLSPQLVVSHLGTTPLQPEALRSTK